MIAGLMGLGQGRRVLGRSMGQSSQAVMECMGEHMVHSHNSLRFRGRRTLWCRGGWIPTESISGRFTGGLMGNLTGALTGGLMGNLTGGHTGNLTGALMENLTGALTGSLTRRLTGSP